MTIFKGLRHIILYGFIIALLIFLLKWLQWRFLIVNNAIDIYIGLIAIFFTTLGIWVASQLSNLKTKTVVIEKEVFVNQPVDFVLNEAELKRLALTNREFQVLQLIGKGFSNRDIASRLFLSVSTIKTHVSNLYSKMDVKSRFQAIEKAKQLRIIE